MKIRGKLPIQSFRGREDVPDIFSAGFPKDAETDRLMDEFERRKYPEFWAKKQEDKKALEAGRKQLAKAKNKTDPHEDRAIYDAVEKGLRKGLTKDAAFQRIVEVFAEKKGRRLSVSTVRRAYERGRPARG
jgi:hypothetical protein